MDDKNKKQSGSFVAQVLPRGLAVLAVALGLAGCATVEDMTGTPEAADTGQPTRVTTTEAEEEFPNLAEVPSQPPVHSAPEERQRVMEELAEDRARATYTDPGTGPAALETAAPPDPFSTTLVINGDSTTTTEQIAGLPLQTHAGPGQLAAIIFFGHGSADLDARDLNVLRDIVTLQQQRGGSLRVVGHASSRTRNTTPDEHQVANFEMSLRRANAVLDELVRLGVPAETAQAEAVGDAEPVYHEFMPSGEAGNRRVEIFLEN